MAGPDFGKTWSNQNCYWYAANNNGVSGDVENPVTANPDMRALSELARSGRNLS